jgi:hypothetical protein
VIRDTPLGTDGEFILVVSRRYQGTELKRVFIEKFTVDFEKRILDKIEEVEIINEDGSVGPNR